MIEVTTEQKNKIEMILSNVPEGAEKALKSAISRATATVRTKSAKGISSVYAISQKDIRAESNIKTRTEITDGGIVGTVEFAGYKIPLYRFDVSPKQRIQGKRVSARLLRSNSKTPFSEAFIANVRAGVSANHTSVFERERTTRLPIEEKQGLSVPQMARNSVVMEEIEKAANETVEKRLEHEISRILNGYGG
jgi:hypothetical protein